MGYVLLRIWAFGFTTLDRTYHNFFIRYPFLATWLHQQPSQPTVSTTMDPVKILTTQNTLPHTPSQNMATTIYSLMHKLITWIDNMLAITTVTPLQIIRTCMIIIFLWWLFKKAFEHKPILLLWLMCGCFCGLWPGALAYPCARYINLAYPFLIVMFVIALYLIIQKKDSIIMRKTFLLVGSLLGFIACCVGAYDNWHLLHQGAYGTWKYNQRFEQFFQANTIPSDANIIVFVSPFVSDIQNIFQVGFNNLHLKVYYELFSTLAEKGSFGCHADYRIKSVPSRITRIKHGLRFTSLNKEHCALWLQFSDHPIRFNQTHRSYEWTNEPYQAHQWYPTSMGKFFIHEMINQKYITDATFIFDDTWFNEKTILVTWDTMSGKYIQLR
jgi:hypothetical protein